MFVKFAQITKVGGGRELPTWRKLNIKGILVFMNILTGNYGPEELAFLKRVTPYRNATFPFVHLDIDPADDVDFIAWQRELGTKLDASETYKLKLNGDVTEDGLTGIQILRREMTFSDDRSKRPDIKFVFERNLTRFEVFLLRSMINLVFEDLIESLMDPNLVIDELTYLDRDRKAYFDNDTKVSQRALPNPFYDLAGFMVSSKCYTSNMTNIPGMLLIDRDLSMNALFVMVLLSKDKPDFYFKCIQKFGDSVHPVEMASTQYRQAEPGFQAPSFAGVIQTFSPQLEMRCEYVQRQKTGRTGFSVWDELGH